MILGATFSASATSAGIGAVTKPGMQPLGTGRCRTVLDLAHGTGLSSRYGAQLRARAEPRKLGAHENDTAPS